MNRPTHSELKEMLIRDTTLEQQKTLNTFYLREIGLPSNYKDTPELDEYFIIEEIENRWNDYEVSRIGTQQFPTNAEEFLAWYNKLHMAHRKTVSQFFTRLAERSTLEELSFYIAMENEVDGRFDDVIALAQLGMTGDMKLALAENYWDEMGMGVLEEMHTVLFNHSSEILRNISGERSGKVYAPTAALKNGNLLLMYALRRKYHPRLLGTLAILEHTAPYRFAKTVQAMRRLGMPEDVIYYHEMHIQVDANHGKQLIERVLMNLAKNNPEVIPELCTGCLIRYNVAVDYYNSVEEEMNKIRTIKKKEY
ncbi:iron-containing redox enzyme family protein [Candidatus Pantoea bituminis]|uniref:iron-containing redox enzyme family protein n=1 Tax=Candidatus Pantoea bituminis TaxID=2831036 RepID=UPI001C0633C7|nr:iron-containing redox enzyme family protein [Pantoea bituminis]